MPEQGAALLAQAGQLLEQYLALGYGGPVDEQVSQILPVLQQGAQQMEVEAASMPPEAPAEMTGDARTDFGNAGQAALGALQQQGFGGPEAKATGEAQPPPEEDAKKKKKTKA